MYGSFENFILDLPNLLGKLNSSKGTHYSKQYSHCHIDDEPICDLIIYFEDLHASFELVKQMTGLTSSLEHHNANSWAPAVNEPHEYFSSKSAEIVRTVYEKDFETFGYSDDPKNIPPIVKQT